MAKSYLGDGVYCDFDGFGLVLTTENGISETNRIVLEPEVYHALVEYVKKLKEEPKDAATDTDTDTGLCCMAAHANATPPWTCDCPCHDKFIE